MNSWLNDAEVTTKADKDVAVKEAKRLAAKTTRDNALQAMVYTTDTGIEIQTRPQDQQWLQGGIATGQSKWQGKDNRFHKVKKSDLEKAIQHGMLKGKEIWEAYAQEIESL